ncbi:galactoside alpha-(1,2)-fucosyltransferase 2-like isoform X2 [Pollicipes pollicipes]|uniref:galactoside alpha-(1,2)-fucosyltransferase 2-like isoform X2 n=1 Tax=Pollicipes pollicipes TaxID=41117 RepID=UPI001884F589|nr:galactoside alpha-(1,2)-fucosyltransferase 2-like isoform X2 [Pollicipes pollicipes]
MTGWRSSACSGWWAAKRARQCLTLAVAAVGGTLLLVVQLPRWSLLQSTMPHVTLAPFENSSHHRLTSTAAAYATQASIAIRQPTTLTSSSTTSRPAESPTGSPSSGHGAVTTPLVRQECPAAPVISSHSGGRLGNNLAEYATIYALGLRYNMTAVATPSLLRFIRHVSPNTTLPVVSDACAEQHSPILASQFEKLSDEERRAHSWYIKYYPHHARLFWRYRHQLCDEFAIRPDLSRDAQLQLLNVSRGRTGLTFVGVHVRRTDYASHLKSVFRGKPVSVSFYTAAMELCRQRYKNPLFILTSDDLSWCRASDVTSETSDDLIRGR